MFAEGKGIMLYLNIEMKDRLVERQVYGQILYRAVDAGSKCSWH